MTEEEYDSWFLERGFNKTDDRTNLTQVWSHEHFDDIWVTRGDKLTPEGREASIERISKILGIGFPPGGGGVH